MVVPGTQIHWATLAFICLELLILFYLLIYHIARSDDKTALLDIFLLVLLIIYNVTGGLLPDENLPGSFFLQECVAYATGFITPCYFPYYVYKGFQLKQMKWHAERGIYYCLIVPYICFTILFAFTGNLEDAKKILFIPVFYAFWVLHSLLKAVRVKYNHDFSTRRSKTEIIVLFLSLAPWMGLPVIAYFDLNQSVEVTVTNTGFLLMMALHLDSNIHRLKTEHLRLIESETLLSSYDERLKEELEKYTTEINKSSSNERFTKNCNHYQLTKRETEIARLICNGLTNKLIGETLFIAERTVAKHSQNIFEKTWVSNRMELCQKLYSAILVKANIETKPKN